MVNALTADEKIKKKARHPCSHVPALTCACVLCMFPKHNCALLALNPNFKTKIKDYSTLFHYHVVNVFGWFHKLSLGKLLVKRAES